MTRLFWRVQIVAEELKKADIQRKLTKLNSQLQRVNDSLAQKAAARNGQSAHPVQATAAPLCNCRPLRGFCWAQLCVPLSARSHSSGSLDHTILHDPLHCPGQQRCSLLVPVLPSHCWL
jgi:hypothetical protein